MKNIYKILAFALILVFVITACAPPEEPVVEEPAVEEPAVEEEVEEPQEMETLRIAIVSPSAINDFAFTQSIYDAMLALQEEYGEDAIEFDYSENMFIVDDAAAAIRDYAATGYDMVIAHGSQYGSSLQEIAPDFPEVSFAWGTTVDTFGQENIFAYEAASDQGGYVNGVMAAMLTESKVIGVVGPIETGDAKLYVEFDVELGVGYRPAESTDDMPVGTIPVDAIFSPITKVNFTIEPTHIGRETSRERLFLEVWTDGTISPVDAMSRGAAILIEQLTPFREYTKLSQMKEEERLIRMSIPDEKYNMPVEQLDLSVRTMNCLRRSNITTVGELIAKGPKELLKLRNFGQKSFHEIEERLQALGLSLTPQADKEKKEAEARPAEAETEEAAQDEP